MCGLLLLQRVALSELESLAMFKSAWSAETHFHQTCNTARLNWVIDKTRESAQWCMCIRLDWNLSLRRILYLLVQEALIDCSPLATVSQQTCHLRLRIPQKLHLDLPLLATT